MVDGGNNQVKGSKRIVEVLQLFCVRPNLGFVHDLFPNNFKHSHLHKERTP